MHVHTDTAWSALVDFYTLYKVQSVPETQVHLLIPQAIQSRALSSLCGACIIRQTSYTNYPELKKKHNGTSGLFTACPTLHPSDTEKEHSDCF